MKHADEDTDMKKLCYYLFIVLLLILSLPIQVVIGICVLLFSGWPIFFVQRRAGQSGKPFSIYKFRTMRVNADKLQSRLKEKNEADGPAFKIYHDPRYTAIGEFLSHTGLDELPQLYNVLRGDMQLFGPRPLPMSEAARLSPVQRHRQDVKPGILSPWILNGYHTRTFNEWMQSDLAYIRHKSVHYDIVFFCQSVMFMMRLMGKELKRIRF